MALVVQEEPFICFLPVDAGFKAAVDFDDFHANEWQSIVGCYFHRKLNGGVGFIKVCQQIVGVGEVTYQSQRVVHISLIETWKLVLTRLKEMFLKLKYPEKLINSAINRLQHPKDPDQTPSDCPVRITLSFKDQKSADVIRRQLDDLGTKINQQLQPVFTSKKIADHLRVTEEKPPLINQQSVVYEFRCDLCDTNYIGYTCRHLHQLVEEHKHSVIGKHFRDAHGLTPTNLIKNFKVVL